MMKKTAAFGIVLGLAQALAFPAWAYVSVNVDVNVRLENKIVELKADQQVGAERLECDEQAVRVVRLVKTEVSARATAEARAHASASAHYSDSCDSCHTSGSGSGSDSDSESETARSSKTEETKFTVAWAAVPALARGGYAVRAAGSSCALVEQGGRALDVLEAIAAVTQVYGEALVEEGGAPAARRLPPERVVAKRIIPALDAGLPGDAMFDGGRP